MMDIAVAHALWGELHSKARLKSDLAQKMFVSRWLIQAQAAMGCNSCWKKVERFCKLWPIPYGEGLWLWSICLHDYVNKELGKPMHFPDLTLAPLLQKGIIQ